MSRRLMVILFSGLLAGCAMQKHADFLDHPQSVMKIGVTTRQEILSMLGNPSEQFEDRGRNIWVYSDRLDVPFPVGFIPVVGDIADVAEIAHTNQELIIQFDEHELVSKYKLRHLD